MDSNSVDDADEDDDDDDYDYDDDIGCNHIINNVYKGFDGEYDNGLISTCKMVSTKRMQSLKHEVMRPTYRKGLVTEYKEYLTLIQ